MEIKDKEDKENIRIVRNGIPIYDRSKMMRELKISHLQTIFVIGLVRGGWMIVLIFIGIFIGFGGG